MKLGIVGASAAKWTLAGYLRSVAAIHAAIDAHRPDLIVSGRSPLGGADAWAEDIAKLRGISFVAYEATAHNWSAAGGFKERNARIADSSDLVLCVVPAAYPNGEVEECYHCRGRNPEHVKSGGCWTAWRCARREWRIIG